MILTSRANKKIAISLSTLSLSASLSLPAFANHNSTYFALEGTALSVGSSSVQNLDFSPIGVRLKVGAKLNQVFDIEAQLATTSDDSTSLFDQFDATLGGVYLKGYLPLGYRSSLYGLGGYNWAKFTGVSLDRDLVDRQSGFSYGFGLETQLSINIDLSADFMRYTLEEGEYDEVSSVNFGVKVYF